MMETKDVHVKTTFVLKNGDKSMEFSNRRTLRSYFKRFCRLFPDVDLSNVSMYKVSVFEIKK